MREPAYIAIGDDGHITLFYGDGTEPFREIIYRGPRVADPQKLILVIEDLKAWAEENGFVVIVPAYDLTVTENDIDQIDQTAESLTVDDVDDLIDDLDPLDQPDYDDSLYDAPY